MTWGSNHCSFPRAGTLLTGTTALLFGRGAAEGLAIKFTLKAVLDLGNSGGAFPGVAQVILEFGAAAAGG